MLTDAQIAQYHDEGYLLVEDVLEPATLAELKAVTDAVVASAGRRSRTHQELGLGAVASPGPRPRVRRIKSPQFVHPFYWKLAAHATASWLLSSRSSAPTFACVRVAS